MRKATEFIQDVCITVNLTDDVYAFTLWHNGEALRSITFMGNHLTGRDEWLLSLIKMAMESAETEAQGEGESE